MRTYGDSLFLAEKTVVVDLEVEPVETSWESTSSSAPATVDDPSIGQDEEEGVEPEGSGYEDE